MGSTYSARRLARKLFEGLQDQGRNHLLLEDFVPYFGNEADARTAFMLFDKDGNGDISKREWVDSLSCELAESCL
jgi:Ca2+-binding EF-hand superfamily protein